MNKYQKQALVDMGKVALGVVAVIALVQVILAIGFTASEIVSGISLIFMGYCIYQLFLVRVGQLESQDRASEMEQKYK